MAAENTQNTVQQETTPRTRKRREIPEIPNHQFSAMTTEWVRKTVRLLANPEDEDGEPSVVGSLIATPDRGWHPDNDLLSLVGPLPELASLTDMKIAIYQAYENRHLVAERREQAIEALMKLLGGNREMAEAAYAASHPELTSSN